MAIGVLIRDLREARGWSQTRLATELCDAASRPSLTRDEVKKWEHGKVIPGPFWSGYLAQVLDVPRSAIDHAVTISRMERRAFLSLAATVATHGGLATEIFSTIAGNDPGPLATTQTSHETDLLIASYVDHSAKRKLIRWMDSADDPILRVNAAGILAKTGGADNARVVAAVLDRDQEVRNLYLTAVASRVGALKWDVASRLIKGSSGLPDASLRMIAKRLSVETLNARDAGARWCAATLLRDLSPMIS